MKFLNTYKLFESSLNKKSLDDLCNNNIDITDMYYGDGAYDLDVDNYAIDEVMKYIDYKK